MNENIDLAADFWNCQCADGYIHVAGVHDCPRCGAVQSDSEQSSVDEVALIVGIDESQIRRVGDETNERGSEKP